jgi:hypothetical protein
MNKEICRADLRRDYETYLRRQRGLSERTIFHSWRIADRFLEFRFGKENGELSRITTSDIVGFSGSAQRTSPRAQGLRLREVLPMQAIAAPDDADAAAPG